MRVDCTLIFSPDAITIIRILILYVDARLCMSSVEHSHLLDDLISRRITVIITMTLVAKLFAFFKRQFVSGTHFVDECCLARTNHASYQVNRAFHL